MTGTTIRRMQADVHALAKEKGWWPSDKITPEAVGAKVALIHSEVSEALEEVRREQELTPQSLGVFTLDGKPEGFVIEMADAVIRIMDLCGALGLDLQGAIEVKHRFNVTRSHRHGNKSL